MARFAWLAILVVVTGAGYPRQASAEGPAAKPEFSAASVQIQKQRLIVTDLKRIEKDADRQQGGRVLIDCPPEVALGLWVVQVGNAMENATPFIGKEGPGAAPVKGEARKGAFVPFKAPVRVTLVFLNKKGCAERTQTVLVKEIEGR